MKSTNLEYQAIAQEVKAIKSQWENFLKRKPVDQDIVSPLVLSSWERSRNAGVEPYSSILVTHKQVEKERLSHNDLLKAFGNVISIIEEIIVKQQLKFQLFDIKARSVHPAMFSQANTGSSYEEIESNILGDLSEEVLGTNAPCLALKENRPIRIIGPEHYNYYLHEFFCCSAPLHDSNGKTIGAMNLFSHLENYFTGALSLVTCLASIFDNRALIQNALEELDIYEMAINNILENSSKGVIHLNCNNQIRFCNSAFVKLLGIGSGQKGHEEIKDFLSASECLFESQTFENREVLFSKRGRKKSLLVSTQKLFNEKMEPKGKIIFVDDTDAVYKSFQKIRGNNAHYTFDDIIGENRELLAAKELAIKVACTRSAVLIYGESGTGKELFAQSIHNKSDRKLCPFVSINCGAIPPELIESELFGYEAGAFTGALKGGKPGKLELASEGTLFLDEIESMPLNAQIKLLRALSIKKITRVGGIEEIPVDVRIISATKTDLLIDADEGSFREDLYYRISTIVIKLPPLRERIDDIPLLTAHLLKHHARETDSDKYEVSPEFMKALTLLPWRGNIRELSNLLERAVVLSDSDNLLTSKLLPENMHAREGGETDKLVCQLATSIGKQLASQECSDLLKVSEGILIKLALDMDCGNVARAAKRLGISKPTLYSKMKLYEKSLAETADVV